MKTMAQKAGLENQRLTNHSARKRLVQTLNDNDIPPTHIMQVSDHKNVQTINNYSHVSVQQQKNYVKNIKLVFGRICRTCECLGNARGSK